MAEDMDRWGILLRGNEPSGSIKYVEVVDWLANG
jgi:hypothetical protein